MHVFAIKTVPSVSVDKLCKNDRHVLLVNNDRYFYEASMAHTPRLCSETNTSSEHAEQSRFTLKKPTLKRDAVEITRMFC